MQRRTFVAALAAVPCAFSASDSKGFNGRWDITIPNEARRRAWWLEIKNADSGKPSGSFVGAPGGDLNQITDAVIENGELRWSFNNWRLGQGKDAPRRVGTYRAKLVDGKLEGTLTVEGDQPIKWLGVRAPVFKQVDRGKLKEGKPIELFNGKDLGGWQGTRPGASVNWRVEDGILKNAAGTTDIMTEGKFQDFKLHIEYRAADKSNSGIGLRGRYEIQVYGDYGMTPNTHTNGALYSRIPAAKNATKPATEWQTYDITLVGNRLTVVLNGETIHNNVEIDGLTAIAIDPNEGEPGPIVIQGDHGPVEFRKITLTPLVSR
jgi:hypothetical protein